MIVIFHSFTNFIYNLIKKHIVERNSSWSNFTIAKLNSDNHPLALRNAKDEIIFIPPVYKQRYERALDVLMDKQWESHIRKIVDFGCAEFGFFVFIKHRAQMKEIHFVDTNEHLLTDCSHRLLPLNADYLKEREHQLSLKVFVGSISNPDSHLLDTDAVVALEVIEHLYPDVLEAVPYNVFSYICPKLAIFTTPNYEFNVLFKLDQFRHTDHKFEWTREQFQSWATNITARFPHYTVQFGGIGCGPEGTAHLGCCSQIAVFIRKDIICDKNSESTCKSSDLVNKPTTSFGICTYNTCSKNLLPTDISNQDIQEGHFYKLIQSIEYPYYKDTRSEEQKILDEFKYRMHFFASFMGEYYNYHRNRVEIPLKLIMNRKIEHLSTESEARDFLSKYQYQIEECFNQETEETVVCLIYETEMDSSRSGSDTEASGYESESDIPHSSDVSDWEDSNVSQKPTTKDKDVVVIDSVKAKLRLEVSGSNKQEVFYDSGYQKSPPSAPDESPPSKPSSVNQDALSPLRSLNNERPNRFLNVLSVLENFDKINELDVVRREKKFFNFPSNLPHKEVMKKICQEIAKHPIAGPSRDPRRKQTKKSQSSDSDESVEDVKSITTCILENSLNKIEDQEEEARRGNLIHELIPEIPPPPPLPEGEAVMVVENGDLANNNRDLEGNNYPPEVDVQAQNDNAVDNQELNNVNIDNNNEVVEEAAAEDDAEENIDIEPPVADVEVSWSSREALFDANSQVDLFEDFDMNVGVVVNGIVFPSNVVVAVDSGNADGAAMPEEDGFPNWLLQIFDEGEPLEPEDDLHGEPHFYCQGDGLGVHPSTVAFNDDDDDDDDGNESDSDSSSSSAGSVEFESAETSNSNQDTPYESQSTGNLLLEGQQLNTADQNDASSSAEAEDVFENAEESESNLLPCNYT